MVKGKQSFPIIPPQAGAWGGDGDSNLATVLYRKKTICRDKPYRDYQELFCN
jgi:hypothetical protein